MSVIKYYSVRSIDIQQLYPAGHRLYSLETGLDRIGTAADSQTHTCGHERIIYIENARKVHDFLTVGAAAPLQEAAVVGLNFPQEYYDGLRDTYTHKRQLFLDGLDAAGLPHNTPQGAYYVMVDISEFGYEDDLEFCEALALHVGVGAVPGSSFIGPHDNRYARFHFAKKDDTLNAALERLAHIRQKLPKA